MMRFSSLVTGRFENRACCLQNADSKLLVCSGRASREGGRIGIEQLTKTVCLFFITYA